MTGSLLLAGCASPRVLDGKVAREAEQAAAVAPGVSGETVADAAAVVVPADSDLSPLLLDAATALNLASAHSRTLQTRREDLYRSALTLFGTRRDFEVEWSGTLDFVLAADREGTESQRAGANLSASRILPTGGRATVEGEQNWADLGLGFADDERYDARVSARLDQPLLAGAGRSANYEALTQAERDYRYALRDFALERQDFAIDIVRAYYDLLRQGRVLDNTRTNYQQFVFLRERSEALFQVNRAPAIDVLRSQQEELTALNRLTSTEEGYRIQQGRFLLQLGLPSVRPAEVAGDPPERKPVAMEEADAVALALTRRVDLLTERDRVEDARRRLRVARNLARPEVDAFGAVIWSDDQASSVDAQRLEEEWRAGISADLPFDRRDERDAVRRGELDVAAAERRLAEREDAVALDVRESFSRLRSFTVALDIELKNIEIAERRAENALMQFRNGKLSNRDVVEAANGLLDARNAYITALINYEVQRLTLLRQAGLLDVARDGSFIELDAAASLETTP
jgi:outer membrane protein TolC